MIVQYVKSGDCVQSRLFELLYILLEKGSCTAGELAERLEVSTRTIYRAVDDLSSAGIPVYMSRGKNGGISLMPDFVLDKTLLSGEEKQEIMASLQAVKSVSFQSTEVLHKLAGVLGKTESDWIEVDFSDWDYHQKDKWALLKQCILTKHPVSFAYYNTYGQKSQRVVLPIKLWFKHRNWYLYCFCVEKDDFRTFKLTRIKDIALSDKQMDFSKLPPLKPYEEKETMPAPAIWHMTLLIDKSQAYRVYDEFDDSQITLREDGNFFVHASYPEGEWVYGSLLSYGPHLQVVEPAELKEVLKKRLQETLKNYL